MKLPIKNYLFIFLLTFSYKLFSQNDISFFDGKTFKLEYFLKDGVKENLNLSPNDYPFPPEITFSKEENTDLLFASIGGYCNGTSAKYEIENNFLKVIERGATTLTQCDGDEETDFFKPITGNAYLQSPAKKVYFQKAEDQKGLWLWSDENHKLVFSEKVLSTEEIQLEKLISIYPNSAKDFITIDVKSNAIKIVEALFYDYQKREVLKISENFKEINTSKFSSGIYFVKIKNNDGITVSKKIVKE